VCEDMTYLLLAYVSVMVSFCKCGR